MGKKPCRALCSAACFRARRPAVADPLPTALEKPLQGRSASQLGLRQTVLGRRCEPGVRVTRQEREPQARGRGEAQAEGGREAAQDGGEGEEGEGAAGEGRGRRSDCGRARSGGLSCPRQVRSEALRRMKTSYARTSTEVAHALFISFPFFLVSSSCCNLCLVSGGDELDP